MAVTWLVQGGVTTADKGHAARLSTHEELSNGVKICLKKGEKAMPMNHTSTTPLEDLAAGGAVSSGNQCLKVFVQRDYSEGTLVKFQTRFPSELEDRIERQAFEYTVNQLNAIYAEAEKAGCSTYCEGCMACLTAYLVYLCTETHYEKVTLKLKKSCLK
uniref:Ras modification protein ERF4 n=1 Tax=Timema tahoe TaxID=61484 RepID=A0A7R9FM04_9NEOP|nr:unnamed protein product [Timema tahoe]